MNSPSTIKNYMNAELPLCASSRNELILAARREKNAGVIRKGCGKIIRNDFSTWQVCACGGTLPKGERRAEDETEDQ